MLDKFSIGQTSELCTISIQTLRYYDNIGLVKPSYINPSNGYRYYTSKEIIRIKMIQNLREMELKLEVIARLLENNDLMEYENILRNKKVEFEEQRSSIDKVINKLDSKIQSISIYKDITDTESNYFEVRLIPDRHILYNRRLSCCDFETFAERFTELLKQVKELELDTKGRLLSIYHEDILSFDHSCADIEIGLQCDNDIDNHNIPVRILSEGSYLVGFYKGSGSEPSCKELYQRMLDWIKKNNYEIIGPTIEEYIVNTLDIQKVECFITEMQIPIRKLKND